MLLHEIASRRPRLAVLVTTLALGCAGGARPSDAPRIEGRLLTVSELAQERARIREDSLAHERMREAEAKVRADSLARAQASKQALSDSVHAESVAERAPVSGGTAEEGTSLRPGSAGGETVPTVAPRSDSLPVAPVIQRDTAVKEAAPAPRARSRTITPRSDNPPRVTVTFFDTSIQDVIASFGAWSGRSILLGEGVESKKVTAEIYSQPWHIALETILSANGMEAEENTETGIISIRSMNAAREMEKVERPAPDLYKINYAKATEIVSQITEVFGDRIQVSALDHMNSLLIAGSAETLSEVDLLIKKLDVAPRMVTIQARIISIARSEMASLGFRYSLEDPARPYNGQGASGGSSGGMPQVVIEPSGLATNHPPLLLNRKENATFSTFLAKGLAGTPYSLTAFIDALQGASLAEVIASPVITTLSNKSATLDVGDAFHVPTLVSPQSMGGAAGGGGGGAGGGAGGSGASVGSGSTGGSRDVIRVGISLDVTPRVTNNGKIWLEMTAKRSGGEIDAGGTVKESFQTGKTEVIVNNGETAVIGGLTLTETSTGHTGVPFLKDLPLIGRLFRTESRVHGERDLIILVTPVINDVTDEPRP